MPLPHFGFHISYLKSGEVEDIVTHTVHSGTMVQAPRGYHPTVASPGIRNAYLWCLGAFRHSSRRYDLVNLDRDTKDGKWLVHTGTELINTTVGIVGFGYIGQLVARKLQGFDCNVLAYDVYPNHEVAEKYNVTFTDFDDLLAKSDFVAILVPLLDSTREMINKDAFAKMKDGVVILNYARDLLVNDDDMLEALESGKVHRYMTDFPNPKVTHMPGVIATPHLGASTAESEDNCAEMAVKELMDYLETGSIRNSVNYPACEMPPCRGACRLCIFNVNKPNMIGQFASVLAEEGVNIPDMQNKSKGEVAYTIMDADQEVSQRVVDRLMEIDGVYKVRVMKAE